MEYKDEIMCMTFGDKLKETRKISGLSQEQFAEKLNISRSAVAKWESNIGIPDVANLKNISRLLNLSIDYLLDENCEMSEEERDKSIEDIELGIDDKSYKVERCPEYKGYYYTIELTGWNDGVSDAIIIGQDNEFLYYQRVCEQGLLLGMIGKKYIDSVTKNKEIKNISEKYDIDKMYFTNKHVKLEIAQDEGILKGFLDFKNDDYLDVVIKQINKGNIQLSFGEKIEIDKITKIEELQVN